MYWRQTAIRRHCGSGRDQVTVIGCGNAAGEMLPPYIVYAAKNLRLNWMENGPEGAWYNVTDEGWMTSHCFLDWFKNHFIATIPKERPALLLFDGHASHIILELVRDFSVSTENLTILFSNNFRLRMFGMWAAAIDIHFQPNLYLSTSGF